MALDATAPTAFCLRGSRSSALAFRRHLIQRKLVNIFPYAQGAMCFVNDTPMSIADKSTYGSYDEAHVQEHHIKEFFEVPTQ